MLQGHQGGQHTDIQWDGGLDFVSQKERCQSVECVRDFGLALRLTMHIHAYMHTLIVHVYIYKIIHLVSMEKNA